MQAQCLCKGIVLDFTPVPDFCSHCHCKTCQKFTGSAFATWIKAKKDDFQILQGTDRVSMFETSPGSKWFFCGTCGSSLFQRYDLTRDPSEHTYICLAMLVEEHDFHPTKNAYWDTHQPWLDGIESLGKFVGHTNQKIQ
ncbi:MAG: GFA family protein [Deltaproteobacteria bacterium]|nr:GFA family protein [Deltaproteobacteria bacterium]